jgi:hypothetical protein
MLMIYVLDDFNIFKYIEIWQWCLSNLRYEYVNMIWDMFWCFIACCGWDLNYANCDLEKAMFYMICIENLNRWSVHGLWESSVLNCMIMKCTCIMI